MQLIKGISRGVTRAGNLGVVIGGRGSRDGSALKSKRRVTCRTPSEESFTRVGGAITGGPLARGDAGRRTPSMGSLRRRGTSGGWANNRTRVGKGRKGRALELDAGGLEGMNVGHRGMAKAHRIVWMEADLISVHLRATASVFLFAIDCRRANAEIGIGKVF